MSRMRLLGLGALCLVIAAALREPPADARGGTLEAIGASMGGTRVMLIDGLFFRAEALRRDGRVEDAGAMYHAVLALDPANEAATIFLANLFTDEMLPLAVDADARFLWWEEARGLLRDALARRPDSAALHNRAASLITGLPLSQPDLESRLTEALGNWRLAALRHLQRAYQLSDSLARLGRSHIAHAALLAPEVAARALRDGDDDTYVEALNVLRGLRAVRGEVLAELSVDRDQSYNLADLTAVAVEALRATAATRVDPAQEAVARAAADRYEEILPGFSVPVLLRELLDAPR